MAKGEHQWLRLYVDVLDSPKVQRLPADVFRTWVNLLALYKREGEVMPPLEDIAWALRLSDREAAQHVVQLCEAGLLEGDGMTPHNWDVRQFASDTSAERMARHRERKRQAARDAASDGGVTSPVTPGDVTSDGLRRARKTDSDTETDSEAEKNPPPTSRRRQGVEPPEFEHLRRVYPKRAGDQGWPRALQACHARLREGCTWAQIIAGAERYAAFLRSTGKEGTEYVKQAATFCGPQRSFLEPWIPPRDAGQIRLDANADAIEAWLADPSNLPGDPQQ